MVSIRGGLRLILPPSLSAARSLQAGSYEPYLTAWFVSNVQPGWTVVDGGANIGYYTLLASRAVGPSGLVFAFEPDSANFRYLVRNLAANHCENVHAFQLALSDRAGTSEFARDRFGTEGHLDPEGGNSRLDVLVETTSLDQFLERYQSPVVNLIKLDIEGSEARALRGMVRTSQQSPTLQIVLECNPGALRRANATAADLFHTAEVLGFHRARSLRPPGREITFQNLPKVARVSGNLLVTR